MRSCLILGTGRSGTSMIAGALAQAGYHFGEHLHAPRAANPKGFFEAPAVNDLNDELLADMLPAEPVLGQGQRWLGIPVEDATPKPGAHAISLQRELLRRSPWCYKDPRFCFTLPAWRDELQGVGLVCVFRHPALTATSMVEECRTARYLDGVEVDLAHAFQLWIRAYREVLEKHASQGDWLFIHYDQALTADGQARLGSFLGATIDDGFPDPMLRREVPDIEVPEEARELYAELCRRANFVPEDGQQAAHPRVAVLAFITDGDQDAVHALVANTAAQRGVDAELILIDETSEGLTAEGVTVLRASSWSRGAALRAALAATDAPYAALTAPGCRSLPARLAHAVARLAEGVDLVTCDYTLTDAQDAFVDRSSPAAMGEAPGPYFAAGVVARRAALAEISVLAFYPVVLDLLRKLQAAGRTGHVVEPGFAVDRERYLAAWEVSRQDAALVTLQHEPHPSATPELTVSLCTFNRRDVLRECLASFCRQLLPQGTFEIVLVDDGSSDGTAEALEGLEFPIPVRHLRRENGGLSAARNTGLAVASAPLVLFINDDTIAFPDLVERHLAAHRRAQQKIAVLGIFEQSAEALDNALLRYLESSGEVFGYAEMTGGELYDGLHFYTCNVSVPLADVRHAGGYDESFRHYGCEDTDLALRLEALGYRVLFEPRARAIHRHAMDFDYVRSRAHTVARAYVRLMRKHPQILARWNNESLSIESCQLSLDEAGPRLVLLENAARELAMINVGALESLGGEYAQAAADVLARLGELIPELNRLWWQAGYIEGMREHGLEAMFELIADGRQPWPIHAEARLRLLAWPRWDEPASLDALLERAAPLVEDPCESTCLVLRHDARVDPPRAASLASLEAAFLRRFPAETRLEVIVEENPLTRSSLHRLGRAVHGFLPLGGEPVEFLAAICAEPLDSPAAVRAWRERYDLPEPAPTLAIPVVAGPELTVIIPTCDRYRELEKLIRVLAHQSLEPDRFEVIVVDDGSREPIGERLLRMTVPYELCVLRQENAGPGAARNAAVAEARGDTIVFFNDDAVPAPDSLRRHVDAQRFHATPVAVMGTFHLLARHRRDSVSEYIETSTSLFAQPALRPGVLYHGLTLCTGNVSLPRGALEEVGGFDPSLRFAGGEDSELGLRLERQLEMRVLFDPRIRCEHDHAMDAAHLAQRKRVIGWAAYRMQIKHGDLGLLSLAWPANEAAWEAVHERVLARSAECGRVIASIQQQCAREREERQRPEVTASLRRRLSEVEHNEILTGALLAHRGLLPSDELRDSATFGPVTSLVLSRPSGPSEAAAQQG